MNLRWLFSRQQEPTLPVAAPVEDPTNAVVVAVDVRAFTDAESFIENYVFAITDERRNRRLSQLGNPPSARMCSSEATRRFCMNAPLTFFSSLFWGTSVIFYFFLFPALAIYSLCYDKEVAIFSERCKGSSFIPYVQFTLLALARDIVCVFYYGVWKDKDEPIDEWHFVFNSCFTTITIIWGADQMFRSCAEANFRYHILYKLMLAHWSFSFFLKLVVVGLCIFSVRMMRATFSMIN